MRTNIEIDETLLEAAMRILGQTTKRGAVEEALRQVVQNDERRKALDELRGIGWEGDLDKMRRGDG
jgi:Arc/MetJ family transcription regulator